VPQEQEQKRTQRRGEDASPAETETSKTSTKGQELTDEMDEILDEIDTVLEQNAEEFVKSYVQKGGE
jgi:prokaryotic ubiquitin-like protein Pup